MNPSNKLTNLIAQTNYLSSMLQSYQAALISKVHRDHQVDHSHSHSNPDTQSIFDSMETEKRSVSHHFEEDFGMTLPHQNHLHGYFAQDPFENEIIDRPTSYNRDDNGTKTRQQIDKTESSIQLCFKAIELQFKLKEGLQKPGSFKLQTTKQPLGNVPILKNEEMIEQMSRKTKKSKKRNNRK